MNADFDRIVLVITKSGVVRCFVSRLITRLLIQKIRVYHHIVLANHPSDFLLHDLCFDTVENAKLCMEKFELPIDVFDENTKLKIVAGYVEFNVATENLAKHIYYNDTIDTPCS